MQKYRSYFPILFWIDLFLSRYRGFGGEYEPQLGFGWTNGVVFSFLEMFGDEFNYETFRMEFLRDDHEYIESYVIQEIKNMFNITKGMIRETLRSVTYEVHEGLAHKIMPNDRTAMKMIPSFILRRRPAGNEEGFFVALDLGGSKFVVCKCHLEHGKAINSSQTKFVVPEAIKHGAAIQLFDWLVRCFLNATTEDELKYVKGIALTFSFPIDQVGLKSGYLMQWTKGFHVEDAIGKDVVQLMEEAFERKQLGHLKIDLLINNTTATLAARFFTDPHCEIGIIVGTGRGYHLMKISV